MMNVHSIFESISGEAGIFPQGTWCTFLRLQGCNLKCKWCDTKQAQSLRGGTNMPWLAIREEIFRFGNSHLLITGGEPLLQMGALEPLLFNLEFINIQIETNGSTSPPTDPPWLGMAFVVDYKLPSSGMNGRMSSISDFITNWKLFTHRVKFVFDPDSEEDINCMIKTMCELSEGINFRNVLQQNELPFLLSPLNAKGETIPQIVKKLKAQIPYRYKRLLEHIIFSVQLHKLLNLP